jgi:hypothetical protein
MPLPTAPSYLDFQGMPPVPPGGGIPQAMGPPPGGQMPPLPPPPSGGAVGAFNPNWQPPAGGFDAATRPDLAYALRQMQAPSGGPSPMPFAGGNLPMSPGGNLPMPPGGNLPMPPGGMAQRPMARNIRGQQIARQLLARRRILPGV